jgi:E3 ubiquitin-protein ligase NEDD4
MHWCLACIYVSVTGSCELPCGCWELNPDPLGEHLVLPTAEPSLQLQLHFFYTDDSVVKGVQFLAPIWQLTVWL